MNQIELKIQYIILVMIIGMFGVIVLWGHCYPAALVTIASIFTMFCIAMNKGGIQYVKN